MWKVLIFLSAFTAATIAVDQILTLEEEKAKCMRICQKLKAIEVNFDEIAGSCQCLLIKNAELVRSTEKPTHEPTTEEATTTIHEELKERLNLELVRKMIETPMPTLNLREKRRAINANNNDPIVGFHKPLLHKFRAAHPALKPKLVVDPKIKKLQFDLKNLALRKNAGLGHNLVGHKTWAKPFAPELRARLAIDKVKHRMMFPGIVGSTARKTTDPINSNQQRNMNFRSKSNFDNEDNVPQQNHPSKQIVTQPQQFIED